MSALNAMQTLDDIIRVAKQLLTRYGRLPPMLVLDGTTGSDAVPLPDAPEPIKRSLLEGLGYTLATEQRLGGLVQLFLVVEGWGSTHNGHHPALRPQHAPDRVDVVMIFHDHLARQATQMVLYEQVRDANGRLTELKRIDREGDTSVSPPLAAIVRGFRRGSGRDVEGR